MNPQRQEIIKDFINITGSDQGTAKHFLDACSDNLQTAVAMFLDNKTEHPSSAGASKFAVEEDEVRAPIPQTAGVLVDDPHYVTTSRTRWSGRRRPRSVFDGFRDFKAETTRQESLLSSDPTKNRRLKRLEDLFRPPLELMHRGTLETAREAGKESHKWLMVNVQNVREFSCQVLNRDVWSKPTIQRLIKKYFVFWQVYNDSMEGDRFTQFYPVTKWPHVSILDPRTGERLATWKDINANNVEGKVEEFLADHGTIAEEEKDNVSEPPTKKSKKDHSLIDDSEDTQLAAAIAASLAETESATNKMDDDDFMISNESSDISEFDGSSEEETIIGDTVSKERRTKTSKCEQNSIKNGEFVETKVDEKYFSDKATENLANRQNSEKFQNDSSKLKISNGSSNEKLYKKVNSRLKVGTVENGKDMSRLTDDVFGEESKKSISPQKETKPEEICRIMVRYPDGSREEVKMAINTTVKEFSSKLAENGYSPEDYDVVTHFPRKSIFSSGPDKTLKEAGLFPRAAVFVQEIES